jgi:hypothetical protein
MSINIAFRTPKMRCFPPSHNSIPTNFVVVALLRKGKIICLYINVKILTYSLRALLIMQSNFSMISRSKKKEYYFIDNLFKVLFLVEGMVITAVKI